MHQQPAAEPRLDLVDPGEIDDLAAVRAEKVFGVEPFLRQFNSIPLDTRKLDFQRVPIRAHRMDADRFARLADGRDHGLGGEVKRYAKDIGVFDVEKALLVQVVGLTAKSASNDLFA